MKIRDVDVFTTAKQTFKEFRQDDLQGLAAEVAYHTLFSVVPLLIFLTALSGFISRAVGMDDTMNRITEWLFAHLPRSTADAVLDPIRNVIRAQGTGFLSVGALLALWGGKNAIAALMKALNVAFEVKESRSWLKQNAVAISLTVALGLAIVASSVMFLAGSRIGDSVAGVIGLGTTWTTVWAYLRWPLIAVLLTVAVAFLYWTGPDVDAPFKWLTPGSVLAVVLWALATAALGLYFQYGAGYAAAAYGALGGVLAFVFWLYVMSLIVLLGGELNSVLTRGNAAASGAAAGEPGASSTSS